MHRAITALALFLLCATTAEARPRHRIIADPGCGVIMPCEGVTTTARGRAIERALPFGTAVRSYSGTIVGGRPAGCPRRFCGCALAIKVFGSMKPGLNLAANWLRQFPRTAPGAGMVAARRGHVFQLLSHVEGNVWNVYDPNSGGGKIRVHHRSIAGYQIVDPGGSRVASIE